jgi:hypothetical protein
MFSGSVNTKEIIRNRMLKHALNYWNIKNTEDLDPVVKLILEALSSELYNLGNEIKDSEVRLLEKIANLLAPEFLTCPNPAHAIMHAMPVETTEMIADTDHCYTQKKISSKQDESLDKTIDVFFTPVGKLKLFKAGISCLVTGNALYSVDASYNKLIATQTQHGSRIENNVLWLGINIDEKIDNVNNLFFYFDWKNMEHSLSNLNYQLLPLSKWYLNDKEITIAEGLPYEKKRVAGAFQKDLSFDYDLLSLIEKDITNYYDRKFITIAESGHTNVQSLKQNYPPAFENVFSQADLQKFTQQLLWVKIIFPAALQQGSLDEIHVYTNSFPVMNRQLNEMKYRLKNGSNIIPLKIEGLEQFLSVRSLADEMHSYTSTPFRKMEEEETGTYTLRSGGVERFDGRNAKEFISYLLELLRSESAAFSAHGNDFIASTLREMDQRIALMEQKTKAIANLTSEVPHYIIAKPYEGCEMMYVEYWTTNAETANILRSGTRLQEYNGSKIKSDSLFLITTTGGGKNRLKPEERVKAFRYGLMTRNRIVTKEDIRNLCFYEFGNRISKVDVERGFEMPVNPKQSFLRTIDITITATPSEKLNTEAWEVLLDHLKAKLNSRSGMSNHYRLFLNNA